MYIKYEFGSQIIPKKAKIRRIIIVTKYRIWDTTETHCLITKLLFLFRF